MNAYIYTYIHTYNEHTECAAVDKEGSPPMLSDESRGGKGGFSIIIIISIIN